MPSDVSLERLCRDQEVAIERLMHETQALRDENADLLWQLNAARTPVSAADGAVRLVATLPPGPAAAATAHETMTRWLAGNVPGEVLQDARLLASELVANSISHAEPADEASLRLAVQLHGGALRVEVRDPGTNGAIVSRDPDRERGGGFGLTLMDTIATRWGVNRTGGTHVWFEVDAMGATD